ncbi:MAG: hypothetical protein DRO05_00600 [Thermoproteota archaeon]|nr:MAG: hypothetical protein DRO05_00600 [Candidatus Korarchaeota archaeon]
MNTKKAKTKNRKTKRARMWAFLDMLEGKIRPEDYEKQVKGYIKVDREFKKQFGFSILAGKEV